MAVEIITKDEFESKMNIISSQLEQINSKLFEFGSNAKEDDRLLSGSEVKHLLNISDSTLIRMRRKNEIPFTRMGKTIRYPYSKIRDMIEYMTPA